MSLVVGFDLDLTLVDTRAGIAATYRALTAQTGSYVDVDAAVGRLGPPLRDELARWFPPEQLEDAVRAYRALYPAYAIEASRPMSGAEAAVAAVRDHGGRVVVITSKLARLARLHLDHLAIAVDALAGDCYATGKTEAMRVHGVSVYIGDHVADVRAARAAGAVAVGVATGPCPAAELAAAGADAVLPDLRDLPGWLDKVVTISGNGAASVDPGRVGLA
jgi:phosphoglycolate phosphatase